MLRQLSLSRASSVRQARAMSTFNQYDFLKELDLAEHNHGVFNGKEWCGSGAVHTAINPATNEEIATVQFGNLSDYNTCVENMASAQRDWAATPAPKRGDIVRQIGNELRVKRDALGKLLSLEMGKILPEGIGEVQEYIDVCDLAAGMSRQLPGQVLPSERDQHMLLETWNPLGKVAVITAFNFPHAVYGWNSAISMIAGNTQIVKGAESASLTTIATQKAVTKVLLENDINPAVATLCQGTGAEVGNEIIHDKRIDLVSFTGSTKVGREVAQVVKGRFGETVLELGGNNAVVVMDDADLEVALRSVLFAAVGTCGQRCTSLRRLLLHKDVYDTFLPRLVAAYGSVPFGSPLDDGVLLGPLHNPAAVDLYEGAIERIKQQGGKILCGGTRIEKEKLPERLQGGNFVYPTIVEIDRDAPIVKEEHFVPIMYVLRVDDMDDAIAMNNSVDQGLSSALFTKDARNIFKWIGPNGSDTGIVNVNTSCSGAEIGGAFGGNKETGGGRECGSDAWKQYMRRSTCTINYGTELPLAQGISFAV